MLEKTEIDFHKYCKKRLKLIFTLHKLEYVSIRSDKKYVLVNDLSSIIIPNFFQRKNTVFLFVLKKNQILSDIFFHYFFQF